MYTYYLKSNGIYEYIILNDLVYKKQPCDMNDENIKVITCIEDILQNSDPTPFIQYKAIIDSNELNKVMETKVISIHYPKELYVTREAYDSLARVKDKCGLDKSEIVINGILYKRNNIAFYLKNMNNRVVKFKEHIPITKKIKRKLLEAEYYMVYKTINMIGKIKGKANNG